MLKAGILTTNESQIHIKENFELAYDGIAKKWWIVACCHQKE